MIFNSGNAMFFLHFLHHLYVLLLGLLTRNTLLAVPCLPFCTTPTMVKQFDIKIQFVLDINLLDVHHSWLVNVDVSTGGLFVKSVDLFQLIITQSFVDFVFNELSSSLKILVQSHVL